MPYLLDANVLIQAKNLHYGFDFCPAFWEWLVATNASNQVFSIEKVGDELEAGADALATWASERGPSFFLRPDASLLAALADVSAWVTSQSFEAAAVSTFLQVADYYLVAHALANKDVVVTHAKPQPSAKEIKIPNVCIGLGIKCMTPYEMLRHERARFILGPNP
jgi:hypothetical protein